MKVYTVLTTNGVILFTHDLNMSVNLLKETILKENNCTIKVEDMDTYKYLALNRDNIPKSEAQEMLHKKHLEEINMDQKESLQDEKYITTLKNDLKEMAAIFELVCGKHIKWSEMDAKRYALVNKYLDKARSILE